MSDFWANKLGNVRPVPRQEPVSTHRPWWDESPTPVHQAPQQTYQQVPQQYQAPPQAKSAQLTDVCPNNTCNSGNYMSPPGTNAQKRCFDCGYPYEQTGSNGIKTQSGSAATPTRQIHDGSSQVNNTPFASIK